jgi:hypothetical protein
MYLIKDIKLVKSLVEKAKAPEHKINTSLLELEDTVNHFNDKKII